MEACIGIGQINTPDFRDAIETVEQGGAVHEKRPCGGCGGTRARQVGSQGLDHVGGMLLVIGCQQVQGDVPATMLVMAQPDDVSEYCEKLIKMGMNGGFILGSGCEVPMNAKPENVAAMIASVR